MEHEMEIGIKEGIIGMNISQITNGHGFLLGNMLETVQNGQREPYVHPEKTSIDSSLYMEP